MCFKIKGFESRRKSLFTSKGTILVASKFDDRHDDDDNKILLFLIRNIWLAEDISTLFDLEQ